MMFYRSLTTFMVRDEQILTWHKSMKSVSGSVSNILPGRSPYHTRNQLLETLGDVVTVKSFNLFSLFL